MRRNDLNGKEVDCYNCRLNKVCAIAKDFENLSRNLYLEFAWTDNNIEILKEVAGMCRFYEYYEEK